ncbi:MAG: GTP 3',8-cyclase MoaA [Desulfobulbaceae bacterium]|nr:GTP 3',8-cyclase MoaA [Desulfobulbaceae bacterium]HIJ78849.1 GTP 3',8-cyclase MoaA [Deltaproteobacteria bacterium]
MHKKNSKTGNAAGQPAGPGESKQLTDMFSRSISYLRISLTDHCNLRCLYCTPQGDGAKLLSGELLSFEEILRLVRLAVSLGIKKVRLTGGEPLVRHGILDFIRRLAQIEGLDDIRLTTNGVLLADYAEDLYAAGIRKLNISLDTMRPERFKEITGVDAFAKVWAGIQRAKELGFSPIKLNVVALRGVNDDEFLDFARLSLTEALQVRFIEFMPIGAASIWDKKNYISSKEIMARLETLGELLPVEARRMDGPARVYRFAEAKGGIGFISPISHHFCERCNRLRLTSEGKLRSCLLSDKETDIKTILRSGASDEEVVKVIVDTIINKPKGHNLSEGKGGSCHGSMSRIGG